MELTSAIVAAGSDAIPGIIRNRNLERISWTTGDLNTARQAIAGAELNCNDFAEEHGSNAV